MLEPSHKKPLLSAQGLSSENSGSGSLLNDVSGVVAIEAREKNKQQTKTMFTHTHQKTTMFTPHESILFFLNPPHPFPVMPTLPDIHTLTTV